jgi:hypothetical protein
MSTEIEKYISEGNFNEVIAECMRTNQNHLGLLISRIIQDSSSLSETTQLMDQVSANVFGECKNNIEIVDYVDIFEENPPILEEKLENKIRVMMYCNWSSSEELCNLWNKMSKGDYTWNNIQIVWSEPYDYAVVINSTNVKVSLNPSKIIVFHMEPNIPSNPELWGYWSNPDDKSYLYVGRHETSCNNNEWHLSKTYSQLTRETVVKNYEVANILSTVLSDKYQDPGHIKRIDFIKFLDKKGFPVHVYGSNKFEWKDYKGSLPLHKKDEAMFPYKYTFNVENFSNKGLITEKLFDGILSETLTFYNGCLDTKLYINEKAYVWLDLNNFEEDYEKIKIAIDEDWWSQRIDIIRSEKQRILNETQFFPRIEKIINKDKQ